MRQFYSNLIFKRFLNSLPDLRSVIPDPLLPFVDCLEAFREVQLACFGYTLDPNWRATLAKFDITFLHLHTHHSFSESTKIHMIRSHLSEFIEFSGQSIGSFSEQELGNQKFFIGLSTESFLLFLENSHSHFEMIWNRYKVKDRSNPNYVINLLAAVLKYNSDNIQSSFIYSNLIMFEYQ